MKAKNLISSAFLAFCFLLATAQASSGAVCSDFRQTEAFQMELNKNGIKETHKLTGPAVDKFMAAIRKDQARVGFPPWYADLIWVSELNDGRWNVMLFNEGCAIPGSSRTGSFDNIFRMLQKYDGSDLLKGLDPKAGTI